MAKDYRIRIQGHLDRCWSDWLGGLTLIPQADGTTVLAGVVQDQAALHGILAKIRDLGLVLVSVTPDEPDSEAPKPPTDEGD